MSPRPRSVVTLRLAAYPGRYASSVALLAALLAVALAAPASVAAQAQAVPTSHTAGTLAYATAESAGVDAAALAAAVQLYRDAVDSGDLPGVVLLVARRGSIVLHEALGWRDREAGLPMERNTLFRMASNTKPVITTAALLLEQEGRLSMSDPVSRYIPAFAEGELASITLHQLATHSSGLQRSPIFLPDVSAESDLVQEAARFARALSLNRQPGSSYEYSNAGYNILGGVLEAASGQRLDLLLRERVYAPLRMRESSNHESVADHDRMGRVYRRTNGEWRAGWSPGNAPDYAIVRASGGMISTALDYAAFLQLWLDRGRSGGVQLLTPENVTRATSPHVADGDAHYGYGWRIEADGVFGHTGSDGTAAWVDPAKQLIVIVFTQAPSGGVNPRSEFLRRVRAASH
jgi:CubicO group peptidase (beta-lactamase class C family)